MLGVVGTLKFELCKDSIRRESQVLLPYVVYQGLKLCSCLLSVLQDFPEYPLIQKRRAPTPFSGLVINIIHSLCTCAELKFSEETLRILRLSLTEFSLPKFYLLFGISKVKSAAVTAFRSTYRHGDRNFAFSAPDQVS